jgi:hypothetical protein
MCVRSIAVVTMCMSLATISAAQKDTLRDTLAPSKQKKNIKEAVAKKTAIRSDTTVSVKRTAPGQAMTAQKDTSAKVKVMAKKDTAAVTKKINDVQAAPDSLQAVGDSLVSDSLQRSLATLRVKTQPESAQVYLDDSLICMSPCVLSDVAPGKRVLIIKKVGCYLKRVEVEVQEGSDQELSFILLQPAFLRIESNPQGAGITIDTQAVGTTPYEAATLKPGEHTVSVILATYKPVTREIMAQGAGRDTLRFTLEHTEAYLDSVYDARIAAQKAARESFYGKLATALFFLGAVAVILMEIMND